MDRRAALAKANKLGRLLAVAEYRRALLEFRVAAAVEHDRVSFPRVYQTIFDVGANRGQFALFAGRRFPSAALWCFEPVPEAFRTLRSVAGERATCLQCALGSADASAALNVARADDSSSLLVPTSLQTATFSDTVIAGTLGVDVKTLDEFGSSTSAPFLLKIDVQGYELEVLRGGSDLLRADGDLLIECSFRELYAGQPLADDVIAHLVPIGYHLRGVHSISRGADGLPLQADFFFTR